MIRHAQNTNLTLHYETQYQGLPVQTTRGPLVSEYLDRLKYVIDLSLQDYGRVFAFRLDLRFQEGMHHAYIDNNLVLERFIASFKAKIRHNRNKAHEANHYAHDTTVRYVWCRELGQHDIPHYHLAILLNNDAFCTLGKFEMDRNNLFNRIHAAWASALGFTLADVIGLVEFPENPFYRLQRSDPNSIVEFFYRASYLCKAETKHFGNGVHGFGASRI
jgi:hypothetical protein